MVKRENNPLRERYELGGICPICEKTVDKCKCEFERIQEVLDEMEDEE